MKLLFIKLPKKEHIENVAGKSSAKISLARNATKRTYPEKAGVGELKEVLRERGPANWSRRSCELVAWSPDATGPGVDSAAAGKQGVSAELEGGVKGALLHAGERELASAYELGVGRSGEAALRGGGASRAAKAASSDARTNGAGLATNLKQASLESTFARTLQHPAETKRPPKPWEDEGNVEQIETDEVRVGENAKAMARRSRRVAKKLLEEIHANPARHTAFDEQAALSARRGEQEAFWRKVLKRNGHWVCGSSEVTTTVGTTLTTASSSAAGKALGHAGKEFNYGKLTLPGDTLPKKTRDAKSTYPWEMDDDDGGQGKGRALGSTVSDAAAPAPGSVAASVASSAKEPTAVRATKPSSRAGSQEMPVAASGSKPVKPMITEEKKGGYAVDAGAAGAGLGGITNAGPTEKVTKKDTSTNSAAALAPQERPKRSSSQPHPDEEGQGLTGAKLRFRPTGSTTGPSTPAK